MKHGHWRRLPWPRTLRLESPEPSSTFTGRSNRGVRGLRVSGFRRSPVASLTQKDSQKDSIEIYISLLYLYHIFISLYTSLISVSNGLGVIRVAISPRATHLGSSHLPWAARRGALVPKEQGAACNDESQRSLSRCRTIFNDFLNCEGAEAFVGTPRAEFQPKGLGEASSATLWART